MGALDVRPPFALRGWETDTAQRVRTFATAAGSLSIAGVGLLIPVTGVSSMLEMSRRVCQLQPWRSRTIVLVS
jgi:hypothetical protein